MEPYIVYALVPAVMCTVLWIYAAWALLPRVKAPSKGQGPVPDSLSVKKTIWEESTETKVILHPGQTVKISKGRSGGMKVTYEKQENHE